jgi:hypothetical protein
MNDRHPRCCSAVANHNFQIRYWFTIEFDCLVQYFDLIGRATPVAPDLPRHLSCC